MPFASLRINAIGGLLAFLAACAIAPGVAGADQWRPLVPLPGPADNSSGFDVAAGPDGTVVAVWTRTTGGKSQVMASVRPPGGQFSTPEPVGAPSGGRPDVAVDGAGNATVVWEQNVGVSALLTVHESRRPAGGSFSTPLPIAAFNQETRFADIAVNSRGDTLVAWENLTGSPPFIEAVGRRAGGAFGAPVAVSGTPSATETFDPQVAVGDDGSGMVVWGRENGVVQAAPWSASLNTFGSLFNVVTGGAANFGDNPDVAQTPNGSSVFAFFANVNGANAAIKTRTRTSNSVLGPVTNIATLPTNNGTPSLVSNPAGDILAAWNSGASVMRAAFRPAGQGFLPAQNMSGALASALSGPSTAITPGGDAVLAWVSGAAGSERVQARIRSRAGALSAIQNDFPVRTDVAGVGAFADGEGNMGTLNRRTGVGDPGTLELRPYDTAPPRPLGFSLPAGSVVGRAGAFSASFRDTWSPFSLTWRFGDGGTASGASVQHAYAAPGTFATTATALDAAGNASTRSGAVGVRALRPDEIDADRDGFTADKDCDDARPAIRPGAIEVRGNSVDENCDGVKEPFPKIAATVSLVTLFGRDFTQLKSLKIRGLERGDRVRLKCKGRGCRRSLRTTIRIKRKTRTLVLDKRVKGVRLGKRARLTVRISRPGFVARIFHFTVKRFGDVPVRKELCQPPGATRSGRC